MSPDIEWRVGEDAEQEIIAHISSARRSRRGWWILIIVIGVGAGLGWWYRSIPAPASLPLDRTPTPTLRALPTSEPSSTETLTETIAREADALSRGYWQEFIAYQDPIDQKWLLEQRTDFEPWGMPPSGEPLYVIAASAILPDERAWAEVIQYRHGQPFRQLRFYRFVGNRPGWLRTAPQPETNIWGSLSVEVSPTEHFLIRSSERDASAAREAARQFEQLYAEACNTLGCWNLQPTDRYFTLDMLPEVKFASMYTDARAQHVTVTLPSPLIVGIYQSRSQNPAVKPDDRLVRYFDQLVYPWMVYALSGGFARWSNDRRGLILDWAIGDWGLERLGRAPRSAGDQADDSVNHLKALALDEVWAWPDQPAQENRDLIQAQAKVLIHLIDQRNGPDAVRALFKAIRTANSLPAALAGSTLAYADITTLWDEWRKK